MRVVDYYNNLLHNGGCDFEISGWGSKESQDRRFAVLVEVGDLSGCSVLDVGCGPGSFFGFIQEKGIQCGYHGVDINPHMVDLAQGRFPDADFAVLDILSLKQPSPTYDYLVLSGVFNLSQNRHKEIVEAMIHVMYRMARVAVAFNILSMKADFFEPGEYYARPGEILDFCLTMTRRVILRHDYMTHDFTVYMYRDE